MRSGEFLRKQLFYRENKRNECGNEKAFPGKNFPISGAVYLLTCNLSLVQHRNTGRNAFLCFVLDIALVFIKEFCWQQSNLQLKDYRKWIFGTTSFSEGNNLMLEIEGNTDKSRRPQNQCIQCKYPLCFLISSSNSNRKDMKIKFTSKARGIS